MAFEITLIKFIQQFATPVLDQIMIGITMLGEEMIYIVLLTLLYWCIDKQVARRILFGLLLSVVTNNIFKELINAPRPIGIEGIRSLRIETATGSSFPSGHTQNFTTLMIMAGHEVKRKKFYIIGSVTALLVGLSRLYLGVHWPKDILGGFVVAIIVSVIAIIINRHIDKDGHYLPLIVLLVLSVLMLIWVRESSGIKAIALFIGFILGYALEENFVNFEVRGSLGQQIIKYIIGIAGVLAFEIGLKMLLPEFMPFVFLRYFLISFWGVFIAPMIFVVLKLSRHRIF